MRGYARIYRALFPHVLLIHTPKCGGTYIRQHYGISGQARIWDVGHAALRDIRISRKTRIVGLIRNPLGWYASYYYFRVKSLKAAPQGLANFPSNHPISVFAANGASLADVMWNMSSADFVASTRDVVANIYLKDAPDLFAFMQRTGTGFWTWTMLHHFSKHQTSAFANRADAVKAAREIAAEVAFIRQEAIDEDVERLLHLKSRPGARLNASERALKPEDDPEMHRIVAALDGEVAAILGHYATIARADLLDVESARAAASACFLPLG
jgi:hypothetical protein